MNLIVDTKNIDIENLKIKKYINEYIDNSSDIFYELSKLNSYWKDKDSIIFEDKIIKEKQQNLIIETNLEEINEFYKSVVEIYENLK